MNHQAINRKRVLKMLDLFNSKYDCRICRKKLRYKADQIIHLKLKHDKNQIGNGIICPYCDSNKYTSYFNLMIHIMKDHLDEKPYGCKNCGQKFHSFLKFRRHCKNVHSTLDLINLIEYDNSELVLDNSISNSSLNSFVTNAQLKYREFLERKKFKEILVNPLFLMISDNFLTDYEYKDIFSKRKAKKPNHKKFLREEEEENDQIMDVDYIDKNLIIKTQFNLHKCRRCIKTFMTDSDYLNHVWKFHLPSGIHQTKFDCWSCCLNTKSDSSNTAYKFNNEIELITHLKSSHLDELPYKCNICMDSFNDLNSIKLHYFENHLLKTDENSTQNDLLLDIKRNIKNINFKFTFSCSYCNEMFDDHDLIIEHFIRNKECNLNSHFLPGSKKRKLHQCQDCNDEYTNESTFNIHLDQHECLNNKFLMDAGQSSPPPIIKKPSKIYENKNNYIINSSIHNSLNNKSFSIDAIVNSIKNNDILPPKYDYNNNHIPKPINPYFFQNIPSTSLNHKNLHLSNKINTFSASAFSSPTNAVFGKNNNSNFFLYNNNRLIFCDLCGYTFKSRFEMEKHKQLHVNPDPKRPYKCHLCKLKYAKQEILKKHMSIHVVKDKDLICSLCFSTFGRKQDLDRHMIFHNK